MRDARALLAEGAPGAQDLLGYVADRNPGNLIGPDVTRAAVDGDRLAIELIADIGIWLGRGMANLAAALDPDRFVIGGGVSAAGDLLLEPARTVYARTLTGRGFRPMADIQKAHFGNDAGLIGAADLARQSINEPPGMARGFWPRRRTAVRKPRRTLRQSLSETLAGPVVRDK